MKALQSSVGFCTAASWRLLCAWLLAVPVFAEPQFAEPLGEINFREAAAAGQARASIAPEHRTVIPMGGTSRRASVPAELATRTYAPSDPLPPPLPALSPNPASSFAALGDNGASIPPDTHGAAGPNHLMVTLNTEVQIQDRTGAVVSRMSLSNFWSGLSNADPFDPKILYDPYANRWMFTCPANAKSSDSAVLIAVSNTNDPTGTWKRYKIKADPASLTWADYPSFGFNRNWIVVSINMFLVGGSGGFDTTRVFIFDKNTLYTGNTAPVTIRDIGGFTVVPAITYDNTLNTLHMIDTSDGNSNGRGFLRLSTITGTVGNETITQGTAFPSTPNTWSGVPSTGNQDFAPQLGSSQKIMNNDDRTQNVVYRNGSLWCAQTVFLPASTATRSAVQWWQLSTTGAVQQFGRIDDPVGGKFFAFPSIAVNKTNDALIGYSRYSAQQYAGANYSYRAANDPLNTLQSETVLKAGEAPYYKTYGGGRNRWGDYSATMVDPVDDSAFWTIQEYAETPSGGQDKFGTWWGRVLSTTPQVASISVADTTTGEGNFGTTDATFTVSLLQAVPQSVTVQFTTAEGTATAGVDYDTTAGTLVFPPGTTQRTVTVPIHGDLLNEGIENFFLNLTNPVGGTITDNQGICTIANDDNQLINTTVSNAAAITVPDSGAATPYSSDIVVNGVDGRVSRMSVTLKNLTHSATGDLDVLLVGPTGRTVVLMSDVGGANAASDVTLTFDDSNTQFLGTGPLVTGTSKPTNLSDNVGDDVFPAPAPGGTYGSTFAGFNGSIPNGTWKLFVRDDTSGGVGQIAGGWTLDLTTDTSPPPPTVSVSDATVIEGDTGTKSALFTLTLPEPSDRTVSVNYVTSDGTALEPDDYTRTFGVVSFVPGQTQFVLSIPVKGDILFEPNETFFLTLTPLINAFIGDGEGVATIQDNDPAPQLSIDDVNVTEGDSGTTNVTFTVSLSAPSAQGVSVQYATVDGSAVANADYVPDTGQVVFQPGTTSKKVTVQVVGDRVLETAESFAVELSAPVGASIADGTGLCHIANNDLLPAISINDILVNEGNAGTSDAVFTLRLSSAAAQPVTVNYTTVPDSAVVPDDFIAASGSVIFAPGETSQTLSISVVGDAVSEPAKTFAVALSAPQNAILANTEGTATIVNDDDSAPGTGFTNGVLIDIPAASDTTPIVSTLNVSGLSAPITRLTVTLHNVLHNHPQDLDVLLVGPAGQAVLLMSDAGGTDAANGVTLTFDDAASVSLNATRLSSGTFKPTNLDDGEGLDGFNPPAPAGPYGAALAAFNGTDGNGAWQLFVVDDYPGDGGQIEGGWSLDITTGNSPAPPALSVNDASVTEGNSGTKNLTFTVALTAAANQQVTVHYQTSNGTAKDATDFTASAGTLTFAPGVTTQTFDVPITGDTTPEPDEQFSVTLSAATNALIADGLGFGTILNDDNAGSTGIFSNSSGIIIPTNGAGRPQDPGAPIKTDPATPYASTIEVTGLDGAVGKVRVVLTGIDHTFPDDIDILLVGPDGDSVVLMSDTGGGEDVHNLTLTFDDAAPAALPDGSPILARTVLPTNFGSDEKFLTPAPAGPYGANLAVFNGTNPNGIWRLFVFDDQGKDGGDIDSWSLIITTTAGAATNLPRLSINDVLINEGDSGTTPATFTVSLSAPSANPVSVHYSTVPISATADADYVPQSGVIDFPPNTVAKTIAVPVKGDTVKEPDETFAVQLDSAVNAAILDASGTATITDPADTPVPNDNFSDAQVVTGNAFTITGTVNGATIEPGEPFHGGGSNTQSVWFKWTAPLAGRVLASTEGSTFDTVLAVYVGSAINKLKEIVSNNDASRTTTSAVKFNAVAGKTYYFAVACSNTQGDALLNLAFLPAFSGVYQGLITPPGGDAMGVLNVTVDPLGAFTGTLRYLGVAYAVKGSFSATGSFFKTITRPGLSPLQVTLHLDLTEGGERVTGTVVAGTNSADVLAPGAHFAGGGALPEKGTYTFVLPGAPDAVGGVPRGDGSGTLRLSKRGAVRVAGRLNDGTHISYSSLLSKDRVWPLYVALENGAGSISGLVQFRDQPASDADGVLAWKKPSVALDADVSFLASRYVVPPTDRTRALASFNASNGIGTVTFTGAHLPDGTLTHGINFKRTNVIAITDPSADRLKIFIEPESGLVSGSLKHPANSLPASLNGVLFQKTGHALGLFKDIETTGHFEFAP